MGRLSIRVLTIISFFTLFSATSCKNTKGGLKGLFLRTSNCGEGNFIFGADRFSGDVSKCFSNDTKHFSVGLLYNNIEAQQIMGSIFGFSAYGFRVKSPSGDMCLSAQKEGESVRYEKCEMLNGRVSFKDNQLFFFAKQNAKTVVKLRNGRTHKYKDVLTHIIPQKSLNSWLVDKNEEKLLCVGLDYKRDIINSADMKDRSYKLRECGSQNFLSVFLNLPSSYENDDLLNSENKRSSLLLMGRNRDATWVPFDFESPMDLNESIYLPNNLFKRQAYKAIKTENNGYDIDFTASPVSAAYDILDRVQENNSEAMVYVNLGMQRQGTLHDSDFNPPMGNSRVKKSCKMASFGNPGRPRVGHDVGQSVRASKGPYDAQLFCFENADIHKRDAILNAAKGYPGADVKRQSPLNNASVVAVEGCESGLSLGALANCDYYQTSRALADNRDNVIAVAGVEYPARNIIQLRKKGNAEDQNEASCLWLAGSGLSWGRCNVRGSEARSQYIVKNLDSASYAQNSLSNQQAVQGSLAKHASILIPLEQPSSCLVYSTSGWRLANSGGDAQGNCSLFRTEGNSLFLPYVDQRTSQLLQSDLEVGFCTGGVNLGANSSTINVDCWDYVSKKMQLLVELGDIISMIPLLGIIPAAVMNGIVCHSSEASLNQGACTNLIIGTVIDTVLAPFDVMGAAAVIGTFARAIKKSAFKMAIKAATKEMGEEAAEQAAELAIRDVADPRLLRDSLRKSLGRVPNSLLDDAVRMSNTIRVPRSKVDGAASRFKAYMLDLYKSNKQANKENFMDIFDEFWRGYFTRKPNQMEKKTAINAVMKAFMLDTTIDPAMRKELVSELIPEVLGNGAGILFWAGQNISEGE